MKPDGQIISLLVFVRSLKQDWFKHELIRIAHLGPVKFAKQVQTKPVATFAQIPSFSHGCERQ